ncbi:hypothetical protein MTX78_14675 [Hymenobacter tibetensis]|uniref:Uncharacterized protein n=1 Tax=Hymenobacter tibetensis TaxID=497967 RepID=A0ABY4CSY6_9BACT|nr:hypothetical protein [Hymenobacter tibetensis]UOG73368.1 hypothetical protein MTX78_14675 [Hymenobacter tibetensis]
MNERFIASLLAQVSYQRLVAANYPVVKERAPVGSGGFVRFSHGVNQFACFHSPDNTFTVSFTISRAEPVLAPLLTLGMAKKEVLRQLRLAKSRNTLQVTELEGMARATLFFQQEKLAKITFQATID